MKTETFTFEDAEIVIDVLDDNSIDKIVDLDNTIDLTKILEKNDG